MSRELTLLLAACIAGCTGSNGKDSTTTTTDTPVDSTNVDTTDYTVLDYTTSDYSTDETDTDTDTDADTDTDTDTDTDADTDTDTDTDTDADTDTDSGKDTGGEVCSDGSTCRPGSHCAVCLSYGGTGFGTVITCVPDGATCGRPLRVDGQTDRAQAGAFPGWSKPIDPPMPHPVAADVWTELALDEHASVAAFARVTLDLLALGAPAELVAETQRAAFDEVHHAQQSFALASAFAGREVGPGPLSAGAPVRITNDLVSFAVATFVDGCLNETLSTALAAARLHQATDPSVQDVLEGVLRDETRHAALAWATIAWALRTGGEPVRRAIEEAWANYTLPAANPTPATAPSLGVIGEAAQRQAMAECHEHVLSRAVAQLLSGAPAHVACAEA